MSTINKIAIKNSLGEYDESKIGAQAEDVIISRDENGKIIENIEIPGVTISSTEGIATTVKEIDERVATDSSIGQIQVGSGFNIDANGILTPAFGNTTGSICEGNDPRLAGIGTVTNNLTLSSNGDGDAAGTTFNGGAAVKISYNSIGAAPNQKATTSQWGQIKIKSNSGLGIDSTNGLSLSSHASASNIYGVGTNANYGHLKIVDATSSTSGTSYNAAAGVAASASSVANVISQISNLENWIKELWVNPNPSSVMVAQQVTLNEDLSNYRFYYVTFAMEYSDKWQSSIMVPCSSSAALHGFQFNINGTGDAGLMFYRVMTPAGGNKMNIGGGFYTLCNATPSSYNGACVPKRIWGIK